EHDLEPVLSATEGEDLLGAEVEQLRGLETSRAARLELQCVIREVRSRGAIGLETTGTRHAARTVDGQGASIAVNDVQVAGDVDAPGHRIQTAHLDDVARERRRVVVPILQVDARRINVRAQRSVLRVALESRRSVHLPTVAEPLVQGRKDALI